MLLALDTSTRIASVALFHQGTLLDECTWWSELNHTTELGPVVTSIAGAAGSALPCGLDAVAVAIGPGSFNGLRVGVSMAQGMAQALASRGGDRHAGVAGVSAAPFFGGLIRPILGAGRAGGHRTVPVLSGKVAAR